LKLAFIIAVVLIGALMALKMMASIIDSPAIGSADPNPPPIQGALENQDNMEAQGTPAPTREPVTNLQSCSARALSQDLAPSIEATVIDITDGDTLTARVAGHQFRVRLWGIDAPESDQEHGDQATQALSHFVPPGDTVALYPMDVDQYDRLVAIIQTDRRDWALNVEMLAQGHAYHVNRWTSRNVDCLRQAQRLAQDSRQGVWKESPQGGIRPWEHRKHKAITSP
jgi:endonuclease YncB( thermonuclease family)